MVRYESRIFLKPVPRYLLDDQFWDRHIRHEALHSAASGSLLSYTWLISHPSDLQIAHELKLIPATVRWQAWTVFVEDLLSHVDFKGYANVNKRYRYGELRLFRLSTIYRLTHLSLESLLGGYLSMYDQYAVFFREKLAWSLVAFLYVSTLLAAFQLCLATDQFQGNQNMQNASVVFGVFSIFLPAVVAGLACVAFVLIYILHFMQAVEFGKRRRDP
ncbi:uncharacterized protein BO95DRAFT_439614 [Aspergillus brunneoviolaceus CBS 621.78]|uniref:Uncharacterized protein n=1 Tax=Aspergillus brunneoviolaceus CBS 621.78 TaxID=1450534 RepID=A0ACD1GJA8_9EURO|nr:hypothetical protein BO95DRAFT_439614 [Aspergillus brunneoviolaceus CBS 621.78]RAH49346.1 hypothetical protein BO95DRAFT_439614 [Aspergillus brunneoviolaceus CBS 621.78]